MAQRCVFTYPRLTEHLWFVFTIGVLLCKPDSALCDYDVTFSSGGTYFSFGSSGFAVGRSGVCTSQLIGNKDLHITRGEPGPYRPIMCISA